MNTRLAPGNKKDFDMEDIEKRAEEYAKKEWKEFGMIPKLLAEQAYIAGASEQKLIDEQYYDMGRKELLDSICEKFRLMNVDDELYENFKKSMEE